MLLPIQYLELLTICLVFLFIFRVFKALASENNALLVSTAESDILPLPLSPILEQTNNKLIILESVIASDPPKKLDKADRDIKNITLTDSEFRPSINHQTVLNNYIGDFF